MIFKNYFSQYACLKVFVCVFCPWGRGKAKERRMLTLKTSLSTISLLSMRSLFQLYSFNNKITSDVQTNIENLSPIPIKTFTYTHNLKSPPTCQSVWAGLTRFRSQLNCTCATVYFLSALFARSRANLMAVSQGESSYVCDFARTARTSNVV